MHSTDEAESWKIALSGPREGRDMSDDVARKARKASLQNIGARLRWLREAFEAREPLRHSQAQWARALRITPEMLNRIELGRTQAPMHVLQRIIYFSGASANFVLFGVVGDGVTLDWLEQDLLEGHAIDLRTLPNFLEGRAMSFASNPPPDGRGGGRGRGRYRRNP